MVFSVTPPRSNYVIRFLLLLPLMLCTATAATVSWDPTAGDSQTSDGAGIWDTTSSNWTTDAGVTNSVFTSGDIVNFGGGAAGTAGTVTMSESAFSVGQLTFDAPSAGSYDLDLDGNSLTLDAGITLNASATISDSSVGGSGSITKNNTNVISSSNAAVLTISSRITGSGSMQLNGSGSLTLTNDANDFTGKIHKQNGGTLRIFFD